MIGQAGSFDPMVPIVPDGESTFFTVGLVEVRLTVGKELGQFDLYETGWSCADHEWRLYAGLGSPSELADFTETLVRSLDCWPTASPPLGRFGATTTIPATT